MSVYRVKAGTRVSVAVRDQASRDDITVPNDLYFDERELRAGRKGLHTFEFLRADISIIVLRRNVVTLTRKPPLPFLVRKPARVD
jgi:hypothetical protein